MVEAAAGSKEAAPAAVGIGLLAGTAVAAAGGDMKTAVAPAAGGTGGGCPNMVHDKAIATVIVAASADVMEHKVPSTQPLPLPVADTDLTMHPGPAVAVVLREPMGPIPAAAVAVVAKGPISPAAAAAAVAASPSVATPTEPSIPCPRY
jgi:hypothetical protein